MNNRQIFGDADSLCLAAAGYIIERSQDAIKKNGRFSLALSGGSTPKKLYRLLATAAYADLLDWKNIFIFWGDERYLPATDENNNSNMAFTALLDAVPIPAENIFRVPVHLKPEEAAQEYEQTLQIFFRDDLPHFDLILLGVGDNGHTASLFPYSEILNEKVRLVKEIFVAEVNMFRITFTSLLINQAKHILFLVTGAEKSAIIQTIFSGVNDPQKYPVQLINPVGNNADWFIDKAAASQLKN